MFRAAFTADTEVVPELHTITISGFMPENGDIRTGRHRVFIRHAHLVFVTKNRHGVFGARHLERMEAIMRDVCADFGTDLAEFNGDADHVHLLVNFPPTVAISRLVSSLKGVSSRRMPSRSGAPGQGTQVARDCRASLRLARARQRLTGLRVVREDVQQHLAITAAA
jgi:REP element-mobilizing transposase RayT